MTDAHLTDRIAALAEAEGLEIGFVATTLDGDRRIALNADAVFPTASVFKVPVMLEVLRRIEAGDLAMDQRLALNTPDKTLTSGVLLTLDDGLALTLRDLMTLMIIISDNTATTMLLNLVGREAVNALLAAEGCTGSTVTLDVHEMFLHTWHLPLDRPVGLDELRAAARTKAMDYDTLTFARTRDNTVSTAADMARMMARIATGTCVSPWVSDQARAILFRTQTTDRIPRYLPFGAVGNKTGSFRGLRNDCGILTRADGGEVAYTLFSFDPTPLPIDAPRLYAERNTAVARMMGEVGEILHRDFAP
ncbi:MAG: serine hydrolase [Alkalilacustris sp.]